MSGTAWATVLGTAASGGDVPPACTMTPIADFLATPSGMTVTLDGSLSSPLAGTCPIASWAWDMGDGTAGALLSGMQPPPYAYDLAGVYTIKLTVTSLAGSNTKLVNVTVAPGGVPTPTPTPSPAPTPTATPPAQCSIVPSFTAKSTGNPLEILFAGGFTGQPAPISWTWNFGDGTGYGSGQNVSHTYANNGKYTVTLTVENGTCTAVTSLEVHVIK